MSFKGHRYFRGRITRKNAIQRESDIQLQILRYLNIIGAYGGKCKTVGIMRKGRYCTDRYLFLGYPDLSFFFRGFFYFCEVKRPGGIQSEAQRRFQQECELSGQRYILAYCVNDVIEALRKDGHNV